MRKDSASECGATQSRIHYFSSASPSLTDLYKTGYDGFYFLTQAAESTHKTQTVGAYSGCRIENREWTRIGANEKPGQEISLNFKQQLIKAE